MLDANEFDKIIYQKQIGIVGVNQVMWNQVVKKSTNMVNAAGWVHEHSGADFHDLEIMEYKENVKEKLLPYLNNHKNILEIGCGSGLLMYELAPYTKHYTGIDFSKEVIRNNLKYIEQKCISNITVKQLSAHEIEFLGENKYDIIIINSVIQYFPCMEYLEKVWKSIITVMKNIGIIFIGDIRDKGKQYEYYMSLIGDGEVLPDEIEYFIEEKMANENELFVYKNYFKHLKKEEYVINVEITDKVGSIENELTKYRYDAMIHVEKKGYFNEINKQRFYIDKKDIDKQSTKFHMVPVDAFNLMYVMFTSGTTGEPKGVMIEHRSVVNMVESIYDRCEISNDEYVLNLTNFCFDISVLEIFLTLCKGLTINLVSDEEYQSPIRILELIKKQQVTLMQVTPSRFKQLAAIPDAAIYLKTIRLLLIGGEVLDDFCVRYVKENMNCRLYNMYGQTETTVWSTYQKIDDTSVSIGKEIDNTEIYILNKENKIETGNKVGEILIGGMGLARGYINNPVLTAEKFTDKLFVDGKRVYRTGDLGKFDDEGKLIFMGREDRQVKINGNRIEIDEIETVLKRHDRIRNAAVIDMENERGRKFLVGYYIAEDKLNEIELRTYLKKFFPLNMLPSYLIKIDALPLNSSGKIERKKLPLPVRIQGTSSDAKPMDDIEESMLKIWIQVLGKDNIALDSDFFALGGDSLGIAQALTMIYLEFEIEILLEDVLANCTIKNISKQIRKIKAKNICTN